MKFAIPEISWHNRDPVLSADFQPKADVNEPLRLATGGTDSHVLIWYISATESGSVNLEVVADLSRHQKAVNVVRWSPDGKLLASGDDESIIFIWKQKVDEAAPVTEQGEEQYKESWVVHKTLRGHMEDILDMSWSLDCKQLASGSIDNKLLVWDVGRGKYSCILSDHKGFVQGVSWDPRGQYIASACTDRIFRIFDVATKKVVARSNKATLPFPAGHPLSAVRVRLYHDDTLQTFYRRLQFSPDGLLIAVPAGRVESEQGRVDVKPINAVYIYTRYALKVPVCILPCGDPALVTRWSPRRYRVRAEGPPSAFPTRSRLVLAVGTRRSVLLYDTQQRTPLALISNIHYTRLTDLTWSPDGRILVASSTDGFCSIVTFGNDELGEVLPDEVITDENLAEPMDVQIEEPIDTPKKKSEETKQPLKDPFIRFKTPSEKKEIKTPVKIDLLEEVALPSWSDNTSNEIMKSQACESMDSSEVTVIEDSEDIKLVYEETAGTQTFSAENYPNSSTQKRQSQNKTKSPIETTKSLTNTKGSPTRITKSPTETNRSPIKANKSPTEATKPTTKNTKSPIKKIGSPTKVNNSPNKATNFTTKNTKSLIKKTGSPTKTDKSPAKAQSSPVETESSHNQNESVSSEKTSSPFLRQAKVTDIKIPVTPTAAINQKAPRRVSFVTLSSPKNSKKKC